MRCVTVVPGQAHSLRVRDDIPEPRPDDTQALVRVLETGVCGTDVEIEAALFGEAPPGSPYLILGHENLGLVERTPAGSGLAEGDLVVSTVRRPCPERCRACAEGQYDMCLTGHYRERGIKGMHGFMCERYVESPGFLIHVPADLRSVAVLLEPLSFIEKGVEQALRMQQRLAWSPRVALVLGAGPVGLLAGLALRLRGLEVTVASRGPDDSAGAQLARDAGMRYVSTKTTPIEDLGAVVGAPDILFEATGAGSVIVPAMGLLGLDGVCILASVTGGAETVPFDVARWNRDLVLGNRIVFGTVNGARRHFEAGVLDLAAAEARFTGWLARMITRRLPAADAPQAFQHGPADIKSVLLFS
ncbi:MAG TPA: glucose 1-dehydrogenase [Vicinamibacteria bacterium]|nr:glucose 1-dehydrogenase [Vicinamibacteria bacterium]